MPLNRISKRCNNSLDCGLWHSSQDFSFELSFFFIIDHSFSQAPSWDHFHLYFVSRLLGCLLHRMAPLFLINAFHISLTTFFYWKSSYYYVRSLLPFCFVFYCLPSPFQFGLFIGFFLPFSSFPSSFRFYFFPTYSCSSAPGGFISSLPQLAWD
jgi:hypothetical protein